MAKLGFDGGGYLAGKSTSKERFGNIAETA
jgi:hypothetical protein